MYFVLDKRQIFKISYVNVLCPLSPVSVHVSINDISCLVQCSLLYVKVRNQSLITFSNRTPVRSFNEFLF